MLPNFLGLFWKRDLRFSEVFFQKATTLLFEEDPEITERRVGSLNDFPQCCRLPTVLGLFCKRALLSKGSFAKLLSEGSFAKGNDYGVATISRLLKITGLFCRISSLL